MKECVFCGQHKEEPMLVKQIYRKDHVFAEQVDKNGMIYFHPTCLMTRKEQMDKMV